MAFHEIKRGSFTGGRAALSSSIRLSFSATSKSVKVTIARNVFDALGAPRYVSVMVGSGEDAGRFILTPTATRTPASFTTFGKSKKGAAAVSINRNKLGFKPGALSSTPVSFELRGSDLIVDAADAHAKQTRQPNTMPSWASGTLVAAE